MSKNKDKPPKKQSEDKNRFKPDFDIQFIAENIFVSSMGYMIAMGARTFSDETILEFVEKSIAAATLFTRHKGEFGIRDRVTDTIGDDEKV